MISNIYMFFFHGCVRVCVKLDEYLWVPCISCAQTHNIHSEMCVCSLLFLDCIFLVELLIMIICRIVFSQHFAAERSLTPVNCCSFNHILFHFWFLLSSWYLKKKIAKCKFKQNKSFVCVRVCVCFFPLKSMLVFTFYCV